MKKTRPVIRGDTVYEINRRTGKPEHIVRGVGKYFTRKHNPDADEEEIEELIEEEPERHISLHEKHEKIYGLIPKNKRKFISKADGLKKEIAIVDIEEEPTKKMVFRGKKHGKSKSKRKTKKWGCK